MHFSIDRTVHTTAFDKPIVDHWLERKIAQTAAGSTEKDRSDDRPLQRRARYRPSYIPLHKLGYCVPLGDTAHFILSIDYHCAIPPTPSSSPSGIDPRSSAYQLGILYL